MRNRLLRRPRKSAPKPPIEYVTHAEANQNGRPVHYDILHPNDKQRMSERMMRGFDDLPAPVRVAINNVVWADPFNLENPFEPGKLWRGITFVDLAVNLLDSDVEIPSVLRAIREIDNKMTSLAREAGFIPPEGRAQ